LSPLRCTTVILSCACVPWWPRWTASPPAANSARVPGNSCHRSRSGLRSLHRDGLAHTAARSLIDAAIARLHPSRRGRGRRGADPAATLIGQVGGRNGGLARCGEEWVWLTLWDSPPDRGEPEAWRRKWRRRSTKLPRASTGCLAPDHPAATAPAAAEPDVVSLTRRPARPARQAPGDNPDGTRLACSESSSTRSRSLICTRGQTRPAPPPAACPAPRTRSISVSPGAWSRRIWPQQARRLRWRWPGRHAASRRLELGSPPHR
jgi:hypothetical protein